MSLSVCFIFHHQNASNSLHEWHFLHTKSYFHNEKLKETKETDLEAKLTSIHKKHTPPRDC